MLRRQRLSRTRNAALLEARRCVIAGWISRIEGSATLAAQQVKEMTLGTHLPELRESLGVRGAILVISSDFSDFRFGQSNGRILS